ncbi:MAG: type II secretion system F family protein [Elusimicrobium sp.]|jgi:tight adherence protein B|nr:type II secretion system F family protein [Elusimicrobium sp.]
MKKFFLILSIAFLAAPVFAEPFSAGEKQMISCAMERIRILWDFTDINTVNTPHKLSAACSPTGAEEIINAPQWLLDELPKMNQRSIVYDPVSKQTLTEATVWHTALANIYEFLNYTKQMYDGDLSGTAISALSTNYITIKVNFLISIDRLNTPIRVGDRYYSTRDSFGGRGRSLLPTFELINSQMESAVASFNGQAFEREDKFRKAADGVALLSNGFFEQFFKDAVPDVMADKKTFETYQKALDMLGRPNMLAWMLIFAGTFVVFFGVFFTVVNMEDEISGSVAKYVKKSNDWAEDFNRQFLTVNVKHIVTGTVAAFVLFGALFGFAMGGFAGVLAFVVITFAGVMFAKNMPGFVLRTLKRRRGAQINSQLMDALILLSNSLKAGMDIVQAFEMVAKDMRPPIADEFSLVIKNYRLGSSFENALSGMEDRVDNRLLSYMIKAIVLQRQVGGNLTKIFERIVETIREEGKLEDKLQTMTAQQRIQSVVVAAMPWVMVGVVFLFKPDTMINFYTTGFGFIVLVFCIGWIFIGIKMVNKLGEIKV